MIKVDISNFRIIRKASLFDDGRISMILAYNEAGKSSLCGAIEYAIAGQAFGLRGGATDQLVTHGEDRMHVRVQIGDRLFNRTRNGGDALKGNAERLGVSSDVLPMLFNQKLVGDGGTKHMKAFLSGAATDRFDPRVAFDKDPEMAAMIKQANQAGCLTTKQVVAYFERMRAGNQTPPAPVIPTTPYPTADEIAATEASVKAASVDSTKSQAALAELEAVVATLGRAAAYYPAISAWEQVKALASKGDALGARRSALVGVTAISVAALEATAVTLANAGHTVTADQARALAASVASAIALAKDELAKFPPPPTVPAPPVLSAADLATLAALGISDASTLAPVAAAATKEAAEARLLSTQAAAKHQTANARLTELHRHVGAWQAYEAALPRHEEAVARAEAEWRRWDRAVKLIETAERDHQQQAGNSFADLVSKFGGALLQGRKIAIDLERGMTIGADPIDQLSESTRWRAEVATLAAIAATVKSPLLVIDGADILDAQNKTLFLQFLLDHVAPAFEHVIVTATVKGKLEDEQPAAMAGITKWIMRSGELIKLTATA